MRALGRVTRRQPGVRRLVGCAIVMTQLLVGGVARGETQIDLTTFESRSSAGCTRHHVVALSIDPTQLAAPCQETVPPITEGHAAARHSAEMDGSFDLEAHARGGVESVEEWIGRAEARYRPTITTTVPARRITLVT